MVIKQGRDFAFQQRLIGQVTDTDGAAGGLVLIGRADTAAGRTDLDGGIRNRVLSQRIQFPMQRQEAYASKAG